MKVGFRKLREIAAVRGLGCPLVRSECAKRRAGEILDTLVQREHAVQAGSDQPVARAYQQKVSLIRLCLHRNEPHGRPAQRFAASLGVARIILQTLEVALHVVGRDEPHVMAKSRKLAPPLM